MRLRKSKTLRVYPNPWGINPSAVINGTPVDTAVFDHEGRPSAVVYANTLAEGGASRRLVGAGVCELHTHVHGSSSGRHTVTVGNIWKPRQQTVYTFLGCTANETAPFELAAKLSKAEPVDVIYCEYYRALIADGSLVAADEASAKEAGVPFEAAASLFPKLARAFEKIFDAQDEDGPGAYAHFCGERRAAAGLPKAADPTVPSTEPATPTAKRSRAADTSTPKENS
jgi:hypothetical protein